MNTAAKYRLIGMAQKVIADIMQNDFTSASNLAGIIADQCAGQQLSDGPYVAKDDALKHLHEMREYQLEAAADESGVVDAKKLQENL